MSNRSNYIDLQINGRLFPSWILLNFKKYKLDKVISKEGEDPCRMKETKLQLRKYQEFLSKYLSFQSPYRNILIYHGLGSGKTVAAINVYNILYNFTPGWNVFILIPAALKNDPWLKDLNTWLSKSEKGYRFNNIRFIHYDSPYADRDFLDAIKESDSSKKTIYIFDEVHNFITNVYNNINTKTGKRAHVIYNYIIQEKKEDEDIRVLLLSGTPAVNNPFELALIFNLLRPGTFPTSENKFNELYISTAGTAKILNKDKKNMFQRRILGLTSYYIGAAADPTKFATSKYYYKNLEMDPYQQEVYEHFEFIEKQLEKRRIQMRGGQTVYKTYTRQSCNLVFPFISDKINGERRPRPSDFRVKEVDAEKIIEGRRAKTSGESNKNAQISAYENAMNLYMSELDKYFAKKNKEDQKSGNTLAKDIEAFKKTYKMKFGEFWKKHKKKSSLLKAMYASSAKMTAIPFYIMRTPGTVLVFSNFLKMEGLESFKVYLKYFGYTNFADGGGRDNFRYTEFHGGIKDREQRNKNRAAFNQSENKYGKLIKIILISPAGSEGISLANVRQVHIIDPYWNEVRMEQLIGRAIRQCSHKDLPMKERHVDIFRYKAIRAKGGETADELIERLAKDKQALIDGFLTTIKEAAVDCELYKDHNMVKDKYQCFKFNENSLFDKYIGPAYKKDIYYDNKLDNGLNSVESMVKRVKVVKIQAVRALPGGGYSSKLYYWYAKDTGVVYDYDLDYPIGKISTDEHGIPNKLDKDTYIIDKIIPIPRVRQY